MSYKKSMSADSIVPEFSNELQFFLKSYDVKIIVSDDFAIYQLVCELTLDV